jgi:hypothetical protein
MPQEDFIRREIDKLGKILAKALADLLGLKLDGKVNEGIDALNETLKKELNFTIDTLIDLPENELFSFLITTKKLNNTHLELLADMLVQVAETSNDDRSKTAYKKALIIYKSVTENEINYSINRHYKIESINQQLGI